MRGARKTAVNLVSCASPKRIRVMNNFFRDGCCKNEWSERIYKKQKRVKPRSVMTMFDCARILGSNAARNAASSAALVLECFLQKKKSARIRVIPRKIMGMRAVCKMRFSFPLFASKINCL